MDVFVGSGVTVGVGGSVGVTVGVGGSVGVTGVQAPRSNEITKKAHRGKPIRREFFFIA
jgi:hypothetical protein